MEQLSLVALSFGVAMDALAVSLCKAHCIPTKQSYKAYILTALFGIFQFVMPVIGWVLGEQFVAYIQPYDSWVAFAILIYIGGSMIRESLEQDSDTSCNMVTIKEMFILAFATSIDALAVGASLSFIKAPIYVAAGWMGVITFLVSLMGILVAKKKSPFSGKRAELLGGIVLMIIAFKMVIL